MHNFQFEGDRPIFFKGTKHRRLSKFDLPVTMCLKVTKGSVEAEVSTDPGSFVAFISKCCGDKIK